jgi:hypothetical protein
MAGSPTERLTSEDVRKTYNYLRIGIVGAVVLLAVSIVIERSKVDCLQTSLSAYYYTPVRAIFVGSLIGISVALIVYRGRVTAEDFFLNISGLLTAVVAVAPTTDVGVCWSIAPRPGFLPVRPNGSLADWVVTNIENNIWAVLVMAFIAVVIMLFTAFGDTRGRRSREDGSGQQQAAEQGKAQRPKAQLGTWVAVGISILLLIVFWWAIVFWDDFNTRAHGWAAVGAIGCLGFAIISQARWLWRQRSNPWSKSDRRRFWIYVAIVVLMAVGGVLIPLTRVFAQSTVFYLEAWELSLFLFYWIVETTVKWKEKFELGTTGE